MRAPVCVSAQTMGAPHPLQDERFIPSTLVHGGELWPQEAVDRLPVRHDDGGEELLLEARDPSLHGLELGLHDEEECAPAPPVLGLERGFRIALGPPGPIAHDLRILGIGHRDLEPYHAARVAEGDHGPPLLPGRVELVRTALDEKRFDLGL